MSLTPKDLTVGTWNRRYREMRDLLHKGPDERKLIVEALNIVKTQKDLSFGERKMLDAAQNYEEYLKEQNKNVIKFEDAVKRLRNR
jgi:RNA polymerase-interacting CarD/CdnL/TRCF family regulator